MSRHANRLIGAAAILLAAASSWAADKPAHAVRFDRDDQAGVMQIMIDGRAALVYQYGQKVDLTHYYPVRSPSGKSMTVQQTDPYPHHRSFWFADTVQLAGHRVGNFYAALYSRADAKDPKGLFRDRIRHVEFLPTDDPAVSHEKLVWEMDGKTPVLDEERTVRVAPLGKGEYLLDITFKVTAAHGDVDFKSDPVHYAWPYIRINKDFSPEGGGTITNSAGGINQAGTNMKEAVWVDYSNAAGGEPEGLALFSHTSNDHPHRWLTRDYGSFGPRRHDDKSGKPFTLKRGESLNRRVGVLVHHGDVKSGKVAERYQQYVEGKL